MSTPSLTQKAFCSWSGGKDSCLALDVARRCGYDVSILLNMLNEDGSRSRSHGLRPALLTAQADAMDLEICFGQASWSDYEKVFVDCLERLASRGFTTGIFGDIDLMAHREWVERVCGSAGLKAVLPLWGKDREDLLNDFFDLGYCATIVSVREEALAREWLGRTLDGDAVEGFREAGIDLCGEEGAYHTFVFDGPAFNTPVLFKIEAIHAIEGHVFAEIGTL